MERFGAKIPMTHEQGKLDKKKPLHVMEETPPQKTMGGANILNHTLPEERTLVHNLEQEGMRISFS